MHHELIKLPDGNYLGLIEETRIGPIPFGPWTTLFQALGYQANSFTPEFPWVGDKIVVWDKDTQEKSSQSNTIKNNSIAPTAIPISCFKLFQALDLIFVFDIIIIAGQN